MGNIGRFRKGFAAAVLAASEAVTLAGVVGESPPRVPTLAVFDYGNLPDDPPEKEFGNPVADGSIADRPPLHAPFDLELFAPGELLLARLRVDSGQGLGDALASGTASYFRLRDLTGNYFYRGTVASDGTGDLNYDNTTVVAGGLVAVSF